MTAPDFDPWADVLVAEIEGQKIRAPQYGLRGKPARHDERLIVGICLQRVLTKEEAIAMFGRP